MFDLKKLHEFILTINFIIFNFIIFGCGLPNNKTVNSDDYNVNSPIVFNKGLSYVPFTIKISYAIIYDNPETLKQIQNAINTWNNAIGKKILILDVNDLYPYTGNDFRTSCGGYSDILYFPLCTNIPAILSDRKTSVNSIDSGWIYNTGKDLGILATAIWESSGRNIVDADVRLNRDYYVLGDTLTGVNVIEDEVYKYIVDTESLLLHELGHILGLGHAYFEPDSVMYPYLNIGPDKHNTKDPGWSSTTARCLSSKDIVRIRSIYFGGSDAISCP